MSRISIPRYTLGEELINAIENSNYDRVVELTDVLEKEGSDVSRIASEVERAENDEIINI